MPKGRGGPPKKSHKGQRRHFTSEEQLQADAEKEKREQQWRERRGELPSDESGSEEDSDDEEGKGHAKLIEVSNPNRAAAKETFKVSALSAGDGGKPQLSRREKEELEKLQAKAHYQKLHMQGKTDEARADLARLALIRKQREEAAKKREEEKKAKDASKLAAEEKMRKKVEEKRKGGK